MRFLLACLPWLLLGLLPLACVAQQAPAEDGHGEHVQEGLAALDIDPHRSLAMAVDAAVERAPGHFRIDARQAEARALAGRGRSWTSGAPSLSLRQQTDRWQNATGLRETEAGIELSLWRPGQRGAQQAEAQAVDTQAGREAGLLRWNVAGEVRERYWTVIEAREQVELARRDLETFRQLEQDVAARIAAGDAAPLERLTAQGQLRERETALHEAEVRLADCVFAWRTLTGWPSLPSVPQEHVQTGTTYPPLDDAQATLQRTRASLELMRRGGAGAPRLLLGARSEAADGNSAVDSLGATLTIPFGGTAHRAAALAAPQLEVARSEDAVLQAEREATQVRHEAEHERHARERALELATQRLNLAQDEVRLARRAYQIGESSLAERLLIEVRGADAARTHRLARIARDRSISRFNHVQGVLP